MLDPGVLIPLSEYLTVGDLRRLGRALCLRNEDWPFEVVVVVAQRMLLKRVRAYDMRSLGVRMRQGGRCVECGVKSRRTPPVCGDCARDPTSPVAMSTRRDIVERAMLEQGGIRGLLRRIQTLRVAKRDAVGRLYYWRRDVDRHIFGKPARSPSR